MTRVRSIGSARQPLCKILMKFGMVNLGRLVLQSGDFNYPKLSFYMLYTFPKQDSCKKWPGKTQEKSHKTHLKEHVMDCH